MKSQSNENESQGSTEPLKAPKKPSGRPARSTTAVSEQDRKRLDEEPDFILLKHFDNSADALISKHPEGVPPRLIARALGITEAMVQEHYQTALVKLKDNLS